MERGAYVAAINRAQYSIEQYNGAPATVESLRIITESYGKLGMTDLADTAEQIYFANIPQDLPETTSLEEKKPWYKFW
jgi:outer membrane protein assembly factor BamD